MEKRAVKLRFIKINEELETIIPSYAHVGDSGLDISIPKNYFTEDKVLKPLERITIGTGLRVVFSPEYEVQIRSKSGRAAKQGLIVINTPGTIEHTYEGELKVCVVNLSNEEVTLFNGMPIAQMVVCPVINAVNSNITIIAEEGNQTTTTDVGNDLNGTTRGSGGFGSTYIEQETR